MNLFFMALFGMFMLIIMSIVSNSGETSIVNIENQLFLQSCPAPIINQIINATHPDTTIDGFAVVWDTESAPQGGVTYTTNNTGTRFICYIANLTPHPAFGVTLITKDYAETQFSVIPTGWFAYIGDYISNAFQKFQANIALVSFFLAPVNFDIMGFTLADLSGLALMTVIGIYAMSYIFIGIWLWTIIASAVGGAMT